MTIDEKSDQFLAVKRAIESVTPDESFSPGLARVQALAVLAAQDKQLKQQHMESPRL